MSPTPRLLHPVPVEMKLGVVADTLFDEDAREPVQQMKRATTVVVDGQPNKSVTTINLRFEKGGRQEGEDAYIIFRTQDLAAKSVVLDAYVNVVKVGLVAVDLYISRVTWEGHYDGKATLAKVFFTDRKPSRN
jgi:hypothetical protein